jgi:hypothetical protein
VAQTSRSRGSGAVNPDEMSLNPGTIYPDGIIEGYHNPVYDKTYRPRGSAFRGPSDLRKTLVDRRLNRPGGRRMVMGKGFARDITHDPWGSVEPEWKQDGGPTGPAPPALAQDASPENLADPRNKYGRAADNAQEVASPGYTIGLPSPSELWARITAGGPVFTLLIIGAAGALVVGLLGAGNPLGAVGRGAAGVGSATGRAGAGVSGGAQTAGKGAMDGVNQGFGALVDTLDKGGR